jgi:calcium/calmodulin-dependent protein kinase I
MIVTELLHGGSLFEYIDKWSYITEDAAVKLFFKIFKSLAYLHSIGIMHRNLKP